MVLLSQMQQYKKEKKNYLCNTKINKNIKKLFVCVIVIVNKQKYTHLM